MIVRSKSFDNGVVCAGEHNLVVVESIRQAFVQEAERQGVAVLSPDEVAAVTDRFVDRWTRHFTPDIVGQSAARIAGGAGVSRPYPIRLILVPSDAVSPDNPYAHGKLAPILSLFTVGDEEEGFALCEDILAVEGRGHTAAIHTQNAALIRRFGERMPASRILANSPCSQGILGLTNGLNLSMTLGCGTDGGTSTTDNVTYTNLLNIKRLARHGPELTAYWEEIMAPGIASLDSEG
jgi:acyl-CoA reductase-like NAD-dependent aldehyde dehydrogenase